MVRVVAGRRRMVEGVRVKETERRELFLYKN